MCDPISAIGMGLQIAGSVAGFAGQQQATNDYNSAAMANARNASLAAQHQYEGEGRKLITDTAAINQEGFDAVMSARQARGQAEASAGSSGIDASSITVASILADMDAQEARSEFNTGLKREDAKYGYTENTRAIKAQAEGRINSMPTKRGPSPLALGINVANLGFTGWQDSQKLKTQQGLGPNN